MNSDAVTVVILIGDGIFFKPGAEAISATVTKRQDLSNCLQQSKVENGSIGALHIIIEAKSVHTLFDPDAIISFVPLLHPHVEVCCHILGNPAEEDVDVFKMAFVLANLRIEKQEKGEGNSEIIVAKLVP